MSVTEKFTEHVMLVASEIDCDSELSTTRDIVTGTLAIAVNDSLDSACDHLVHESETND